MYPKSPQIYLAKSVGEYIANILTSIFGDIEETEPKYKITNDNIIIYNFGLADDSGYYMTNNFIELFPTPGRTDNLFDIKSRKILINGEVLQDSKKKRIIEEAIKAALIETNQASETNQVIIKDDMSLLVVAYGTE
jgi:hypothetical protein